MDQRQIWQHKASGGRYAVVLIDGIVSEAAGPLDQSEIDAILAGEMFDNDIEVAAALLLEADFLLVSEY